MANRRSPHPARARVTLDDPPMITVGEGTMEWAMLSGDRVLIIDVTRRVPVPPGISVLGAGMGIVASRLEHVSHFRPVRLVVESVDPDYGSYEYPAEEIRVVGRATWVSRGSAGAWLAGPPLFPRQVLGPPNIARAIAAGSTAF